MRLNSPTGWRRGSGRPPPRCAAPRGRRPLENAFGAARGWMKAVAGAMRFAGTIGRGTAMNDSEWERLHGQLWRAVRQREGEIERELGPLADQVAAEVAATGSTVPAEARERLTEYLEGVRSSIQGSIREAVKMVAEPAVAAPMRSKFVADLTQQVQATRWPDGLNLSTRIWAIDRDTKAAMSRTLAKGVRAGQSVATLLYDMQYAIEAQLGGPFANVAQHTTDHDPYRFLSQIGETIAPVYDDPKMRRAWAKEVGKFEARIANLRETGTANGARQFLIDLNKAVQAGNQAGIESSLKWWLYDRQLYRLKRIARTEMASAHHGAIVAAALEDDDVIGYQWRLSSSHPFPDICDYYAGVDFGLGRGVWPKEKVPPEKAHPHCMCSLVPRVTPVQQPGRLSPEEMEAGRNKSEEKRAREWDALRERLREVAPKQ